MATPEAHDLGVELQRALGFLDSIHGLLKDEVLGSGIRLMHTLQCNKASSCSSFVAAERQALAPLQAAKPGSCAPEGARSGRPWQRSKVLLLASALSALQPQVSAGIAPTGTLARSEGPAALEAIYALRPMHDVKCLVGGSVSRQKQIKYTGKRHTNHCMHT